MRSARGALPLMGLAAALACGEAGPPSATPSGTAAEPAAAETAEAAPSPAASGNRTPVIESVTLEPDRARPGEPLAARVEAWDDDGDALTLAYRWTVDGRPVQETGPFLVVPEAPRDAPVEVSVTASDGTAKSLPLGARAQVGNRPPRMREVATLPAGEARSTEDLEAQPVATDPDDDPVTYRYRWTRNGRDLAEEGPTLGADRFDRGDRIAVVVVASDGIDESEPLESEPVRVVNAPPRITSTPGAMGEDGVFRYRVAAEDPDGDGRLSYRVLSGPEGMTVAETTGALRWTPGPDAAGTHAVQVEVADPFGARSTQLFEVRLSYADDLPPASPQPAE